MKTALFLCFSMLMCLCFANAQVRSSYEYFYTYCDRCWIHFLDFFDIPAENLDPVHNFKGELIKDRFKNVSYGQMLVWLKDKEAHSLIRPMVKERPNRIITTFMYPISNRYVTLGVYFDFSEEDILQEVTVGFIIDGTDFPRYLLQGKNIPEEE